MAGNGSALALLPKDELVAKVLRLQEAKKTAAAAEETDTAASN